jgi:hypothetical protein
MDLNNLIYLPKLANSNNDEQFLRINSQKDELIIKYLKLFDSFDEIKLFHIDKLHSTGPELKNLIIHFQTIKGNLINFPKTTGRIRPLPLRSFTSNNENTPTINFEEEKNKIDLERFTPKIIDGHIVNSYKIENYIVKDIYINEDINNFENLEDYLKYFENVENGSILLIINNHKEKIYSYEEHRNLHEKCNYFDKFTDITQNITINIECQTKLFKENGIIKSHSGPFLKYTMKNIDYINNTEFYNKLSIDELILSIKSNWYLKYADDFVKRYDLNEYLNSLSPEERDSEIQRRKDQKELEDEELMQYYEEQRKEDYKYKNKWDSSNSSFYEATDGQLGELGEEGWTSIGRD